MDNLFQAATATAAVTTTVAGGAETGADSADADYVTCASEGAAVAAAMAVVPASGVLVFTTKGLGSAVCHRLQSGGDMVGEHGFRVGFPSRRCSRCWFLRYQMLPDVAKVV